MKFLLILSVVVVSALAQVPCDTPQQWEAVLHRYSAKEKKTIVGTYSYDAINKRERFLGETASGGPKDPTDTIYLFNQQTEYIYELEGKTCTKKAITSPWNNAGVPKNATLASTAYIGAQAVTGENIQVAVWSAQFPSTTVPGETVTMTGIFSITACLPIYSVYESPSLGKIRYSFFNIVPGIKNPNVFVPPKECLN